MNHKIVRYLDTTTNVSGYGIVEGSQIAALERQPWVSMNTTGETLDSDKVVLLAPVEPSKIVCIGLNYQAHVAASQSADDAPERPLIFLKPSSSIIGPGNEIIHPSVSERVDYDAELGVFIGKTAKDVSVEQAEELVTLARENGKVLMVDHTFIYSPSVRKMKEIVDSGQLGDLLFVDSVRINLGLFQRDGDGAVHSDPGTIVSLGALGGQGRAVGRIADAPPGSRASNAAAG